MTGQAKPAGMRQAVAIEEDRIRLGAKPTERHEKRRDLAKCQKSRDVLERDVANGLRGFDDLHEGKLDDDNGGVCFLICTRIRNVRTSNEPGRVCEWLDTYSVAKRFLDRDRPAVADAPRMEVMHVHMALRARRPTYASLWRCF
jgi:hypothetical protein